jgi:GNAT superfamily N-acetyltransferase
VSGAGQVTLRPAVARDAAGIAAVHVLAWQRAYRGIFSESLLQGLDAAEREASWAARLASPGPGEVVIVAERGEPVIGFASAGPARDEDLQDGRHLELYAIYLHPEHWSAGIGSALLEHTLAQAVAVTPSAAAVTLWVLEQNRRARRFYERHGFSTDGAVTEYEQQGESAAELRYRRPA